METVAIHSAEGVSALLYEKEDHLIAYGLQKMMMLVDHHWAEIATHMSHLEGLYERESFQHREMAALILSKLFYHLSEYQEALNYALLAGDYFDVNDKSEFVETMLTKILDVYMESRKSKMDQQKEDTMLVLLSHRIEQIVERMLSRSTEKEYRQAIGIAIECRRVDLIVKALQVSTDRLDSAHYVLTVLSTMVSVGEFYHTLMNVLIDIFQSERDYISVSRCYAMMGHGDSVGDLLISLMNKNGEHENDNEDYNRVMSYNIAFDFLENASELVIETAWKRIMKRTGYSVGLYDEVEHPSNETLSMTWQKSDSSEKTMNDEEGDQKAFYDSSLLERYRSILSGKLTMQLYSEFLYRADHTDTIIIRNMKNWVEMRSSSVHQAAMIIANALMRFGTFNTQFLKDSVDMLRRQTHWGRFNAVATAGLIFRDHHKHAMSLLQPHLNASSDHRGSSTGYSEGGAYFALGLIHSHHGHKIKKELLNHLKTIDNENTQHGIALGLAVAAFSTADEEVYDALKNVLYMDHAISGEAAGYAMGMTMCDRENDTAFLEMLEYARETQHEKIIRSLAMGLAFMMYGKQYHAQPRIEELCTDKDPLIRYGGMYMCGLAYAGTSNNEAIRKLLHYAVSDVSPDVRRAAVTCIGFVMFREPKQCPKVVQLLSESFNPHVRYGAAMALGIACSGSGLQEAVNILQVLALDMIDFVRQGALIALGMVLIQHNEASCSEMPSIRKVYDKVISERHEDAMAKLGAILGQGIMDAGGRNCTIALQSKSGHLNKMGIIGIATFLQYWYWHPLLCFIGMSLEPTGLIALSPRLVMPKVQFISHVRPTLTAYPAPTSVPVVSTPQKVPTAILSSTVKARLRARREKRSTQLEPPKTTTTTTTAATTTTTTTTTTSSSSTSMMVDTLPDEKTTTPTPATPAPATPAPATPAPATPAPTTSLQTTSAPATPIPTTPTRITSAPTTPAPTTPASTTPIQTASAPTTPASILPMQITPPPSKSPKLEPSGAEETAKAAAIGSNDEIPSSPSKVKKETPTQTTILSSPSTAEDRRMMIDSSEKDILENPTRILPRYLRYVTLLSDRYEKDRFLDLYGIVVLHDKRPHEEEMVVPFTIPMVATATTTDHTGSIISSSSMMMSDEPEPAMPEPFELPEELLPE